MSYNWVSASTAEGRDRLKELMDKGEPLAMREDNSFGGKRIIEGIKIDRTYYVGNRGVPSSLWAKWDLNGVEFLDPEQNKPDTDENGLLPCPLCGGKGEYKVNTYVFPHTYAIVCNECLVKIEGKDIDRLLPRWNRRA